MKTPLRFGWLLLLVFALLAAGCSPDDDDDDHQAPDDDTADDDTADDDVVDDDVADDDTTDDDSADDDSSGEESGLIVLGGGTPGFYGHPVAKGPDGTLFIALARGGTLTVHRLLDGVQVLAVPDVLIYRNVDMAVDADGHFHFVYHLYSTGGVRYVTNATGEWTATMIASAADDEYPCQIAVDPTGVAHVVYVKMDTDETMHVYYATNGSGAWVSTKLEHIEESYYNGGPGLTVDAEGHAYLAFSSLLEVMVANNRLGYWVQQRLTDCPNGGKFTNLALDGDNNLHVFYDYGTNLVHGVSANGTDWDCQTLGPGGRHIGATLDNEGSLHVGTNVYANADNGHFYHYTNESGDWTYEEVPDFPQPYLYETRVDMVVDSDGLLHAVAFESNSMNTLRVDRTAKGWSAGVTLVPGGSISALSSLALDPDARPAVAFGADRLWLVSRHGDEWVYGDLLDNGYDPRLVFDSAGNHHLFYYGGTSGGMNYLTDRSGSWVEEVVDYRAGEYPSNLQLDSEGYAHVAYFSPVLPKKYTSSLIYAANASGSWQIEDVGYGIDDAYGNIGLLEVAGQWVLAFGANTGLYVVRRETDGWVGEQLATDRTWLEDMVADESGALHLLASSTDDGLVEVSDESGSWSTTTISSSTPYSASVALDPTGTLHAVWSTGNLLYHSVCKEGVWTKEPLSVPLMQYFWADLVFAPDGLAHVSTIANDAQWYLSFYPDGFPVSAR